MAIGIIDAYVREMLRGGNVVINDADINDAEINDATIDGGTIDGVEVTGDLIDATTYIVDNSDATKRLKFELGGQTTGTDRTLTPPNADDTIMGLATAQTVTGAKTFGAAGAVGKLKIAGTTSGAVTLDATAVAGTGVLTLPAATDTLVGKATTDTLTNKTLTAPVMTTPTLGVATATSINKVAFTAPATGATLVVPDGAAITLPTGTRTLASLDGSETLSNKTFGAGTVLSTTTATGVQAKGAASGAAGAVTSLTVVKSSMADNTAVDAFTVTVPNGTIGGALFVKAAGILGDCDSAGAMHCLIPISRIAGAALKTALNDYGASSQQVNTSGAVADATVDVIRGATVGAVGATQTFTVQVKVQRTAGASTLHTAVLEVVLLNGMASGITIAAA